MKLSERLSIVLGWILISISAISTIGMLRAPHYRDPFIEAFLTSPDSGSLTGALGFIVGSNAFTIPAVLLGVYALIRKNSNAKPLLAASIALFLIVSGIQFRPSSASHEETRSGPIVITLPGSEYQVTFPHPAKRRVVSIGGIQSIAYESQSPPYLRAEFINDIDTATISSNFHGVLEDYARFAGLQNPEITEAQEDIGIVGTYSGVKSVGDLAIKIYGKLILGDSSAINCLISEDLEAFPSEDTTKFLVSIKKKK